MHVDARSLLLAPFLAGALAGNDASGLVYRT